MAVRVQISDDGRLTIPDEARRRLQIGPGDTLLADVRDGALVLIPDPQDAVARLHGLHRDIWEGIDPDEYVRRERESWPE
jgi:AbrB family looped-hinge helix DNA binding protein